MILFAAIALAVVVIGSIAYPIVRPRRAVAPVKDERLGQLHSERENTCLAIEELKSDYEQGKLSLGDYQDLEKKYKEKAISICKEIDAWEEGGGLEDEIEEEVMRLRRAAAEGLVCAQCGREITRDARSCPSCGSPLPLRCSCCGATCEVGGHFCSWCGESLSPKGEA